MEAELATIAAVIDTIVFDLYRFSDADRVAALATPAVTSEASFEDVVQEEDEEIGNEPGVDQVDQTDGLLSWAFGRFDWRLATGERAVPSEPDPFDPLPAQSPAMLPDEAEPFHVNSGILVDDLGHPHDLARLIEEVLALVEAEARADARRWQQREFFPFHLQNYSKSRRKAPTYWPLSTTSGSYTLWLYYPSLTSQTLYTAVNDFVDPKLKHVTDEVAALRAKGGARSRDDDKKLEALQALETELSDLRDTLLRIVPTYRPNHDDGVQITAAPLWPLFRHKPWQNLLRATWVKLEKGDYDWSHLAMAYRPVQVREKCKTNKSLAIAHGRLKKASVLAAHDPARRYREICQSLADDDTALIDASESSIVARERAMLALAGLGKPGRPKQLLVYIPARGPVTDEERQKDPFAAYSACGASFPDGDGDGYEAICLKAKPDNATEIRRLFAENPSPTFTLIDNVGGGLSWPTLRTSLKAESAREILLALLVPSAKQVEALKASEGWAPEAKALLAKTLA